MGSPNSVARATLRDVAREATQADVARECRFDRRTVSFAFSDPARLNPDTLDRILAAARKIGYVYKVRLPRSDAGASRPRYLDGFRCVHGVEQGCDGCRRWTADLVAGLKGGEHSRFHKENARA